MREAMDNEAGMKALVEAHMAPWAKVAAGYVRRGQELGHLRASVDPEAYLVTVAATVVGCVAALSVGAQLSPGEVEGRPRAVQQAIRGARDALFRDRE